MHCLPWLRSRHSKPKRHTRTRRSETNADPGLGLLPFKHTVPTHQRSHSWSYSLPRTPPRPLLDGSDSPLTPMSSGSIIRAVPLENPFVTRSTAISLNPQVSLTTGFQRRLQERATSPGTRSSSSGPVLRYRRTTMLTAP
jgi:hypothetical protein